MNFFIISHVSMAIICFLIASPILAFLSLLFKFIPYKYFFKLWIDLLFIWIVTYILCITNPIQNFEILYFVIASFYIVCFHVLQNFSISNFFINFEKSDWWNSWFFKSFWINDTFRAFRIIYKKRFLLILFIIYLFILAIIGIWDNISWFWFNKLDDTKNIRINNKWEIIYDSNWYGLYDIWIYNWNNNKYLNTIKFDINKDWKTDFALYDTDHNSIIDKYEYFFYKTQWYLLIISMFVFFLILYIRYKMKTTTTESEDEIEIKIPKLEKWSTHSFTKNQKQIYNDIIWNIGKIITLIIFFWYATLWNIVYWIFNIADWNKYIDDHEQCYKDPFNTEICTWVDSKIVLFFQHMLNKNFNHEYETYQKRLQYCAEEKTCDKTKDQLNRNEFTLRWNDWKNKKPLEITQEQEIKKEIKEHMFIDTDTEIKYKFPWKPWNKFFKDNDVKAIAQKINRSNWWISIEDLDYLNMINTISNYESLIRISSNRTLSWLNTFGLLQDYKIKNIYKNENKIKLIKWVWSILSNKWLKIDDMNYIIIKAKNDIKKKYLNDVYSRLSKNNIKNNYKSKLESYEYFQRSLEWYFDFKEFNTIYKWKQETIRTALTYNYAWKFILRANPFDFIISSIWWVVNLYGNWSFATNIFSLNSWEIAKSNVMTAYKTAWENIYHVYDYEQEDIFKSWGNHNIGIFEKIWNTLNSTVTILYWSTVIIQKWAMDYTSWINNKIINMFIKISL